MKKILWLSRHSPLPAQRDKLEEIFGEIEITQDPNPFDDVDDIIKRLQNYDDLVIVAPLSVIHQLTQRGINPIWAEMKAVSPEKFDPYDTAINGKGRYTKFQTFKRIKKVELILEDLEKKG